MSAGTSSSAAKRRRTSDPKEQLDGAVKMSLAALPHYSRYCQTRKTLLAAETYSLFIEPTVKGTAPTAKHLQKLNLA